MTTPPAAHPPTRPLAVCIDDLGLHAGVNRAAFELAQAGRVSSWSGMVEGPAIAEVAQWLRQHPHDNLEVGLHLNLTEPLPGAWHRPLKALILDSYRRRLDGPQLAAALRRQFDAFEQLFGRAPDFIDGHQHVHQLPGVREALLAELARRPGARPWLRRCAAPAHGVGLPGPERVKPWIIQTLGCAALSRGARQAGLLQNERLLGVRRFLAGAAGFEALLAAWLDRAGERDLLMVHPAAALAGLDDPLLAARDTEYRVLQSPAFAAMLAHHGRHVQTLGHTLHTPAIAS